MKFVFVMCFALLSPFLYSQKKKEIKRLGIKTITTTEIRGTKTQNDSKLTYNALGQLTEEVQYTEAGVLLSTIKYRYNSDGETVEELEYDGKNVLHEKRTMKYNALLQKTEELVVDRTGKQVKKFIYKYNAKGLRSERKTYDANNVLIVTKKFEYGYK